MFKVTVFKIKSKVSFAIYDHLYEESILSSRKCLRGDGSKPKRGTNSSSTGTKIVPVGPWIPTKKIPFIKNGEYPTEHIQKREIVYLQRT